MKPAEPIEPLKIPLLSGYETRSYTQPTSLMWWDRGIFNEHFFKVFLWGRGKYFRVLGSFCSVGGQVSVLPHGVDLDTNLDVLLRHRKWCLNGEIVELNGGLSIAMFDLSVGNHVATERSDFPISRTCELNMPPSIRPKTNGYNWFILNQAFIWAVIKYSIFVAEVMMCGTPVINLASESHKLDSPPDTACLGQDFRVTGNVQMVHYRNWAVGRARRYGVKGWVANGSWVCGFSVSCWDIGPHVCWDIFTTYNYDDYGEIYPLSSLELSLSDGNFRSGLWGLAMGSHGPFSSMIYLLNIRGTWRFSIAKCELTRVWNWLVVWNMFYFSIYWEFHHPNWRTHIF